MEAICRYVPPFFPEDLVIEILLRLPVKSLLRFKSVCHQWHEIIRSPTFIRNHSLRDNNYIGLLFCWCRRADESRRYNVYSFSLYPDETLERREEMNHGRFDIAICALRGPCNGVLCVLQTDGRLALWNPATRKLRMVPPCPLKVSLNHYFGFGTDPLTDEFKIVVARGKCGRYDCVVYNANSDSCWRLLEQEALLGLESYMMSQYSVPVFANGFCYWVKYKMMTINAAIIAFDMRNDSFQEIKMPEIPESHRGRILDLYDDSLALLTYDPSRPDDETHIDLWMMKERGCWTKIYTVFLPCKPSKIYGIGIWKRNLTFAITGVWQLMIYDSDSGNTRILEYPRTENGGFIWCSSPFPYEGTLVSV